MTEAAPTWSQTVWFYLWFGHSQLCVLRKPRETPLASDPSFVKKAYRPDPTTPEELGAPSLGICSPDRFVPGNPEAVE